MPGSNSAESSKKLKDEGEDAVAEGVDEKEKSSETTTAKAQDDAKETEGIQTEVVPSNVLQKNDWQAIYSAQHNAYYFYNLKTQETTWVNPLEPPKEDVAAPPPLAPITYPQAAPVLDGIDPELAYLDPTGVASGPSNPGGIYAARFNARTGKFTAPDARDPSHMSEYERAKRMSTVFFDVSAWEQEVAERKAQEAQDEAEGRNRRKKPSKLDLERFKAQKEAKKKTRYAWLRE